MAKTWENIESFDEIIMPKEREIILDLESGKIRRCPHLEKTGEFFYYCGIGVPESMTEEEKRELAPFNPVYLKHVGVVEMQLYCMSTFEVCHRYKEGSRTRT